MKETIEYPRQQARCLHFDANGKKVPQTSQNAAPAYDPWRVLKELQADAQEPVWSQT